MYTQSGSNNQFSVRISSVASHSTAGRRTCGSETLRRDFANQRYKFDDHDDDDDDDDLDDDNDDDDDDDDDDYDD